MKKLFITGFISLIFLSSCAIPLQPRIENGRESVTGMEFVWIPGGCFEMGSQNIETGRNSDETPVHEVCVDGFWMGKYEVTNAQYRRYKSFHDSKEYHGKSLDSEKQPVVRVSWKDAKAFANWLTQKYGGHYIFRLPTEAEWEYACRAGTKTARFWGDDPDVACRYENIYDRSINRYHRSINIIEKRLHNCDDGYVATAPVGNFQPNGFGLHDMLGNIGEWCEDIYNKDAYSKHYLNNPIYSGSGTRRVHRGGNWYNFPRDARCAIRKGNSADVRYGSLGFRLVTNPSKRK